MPPVFPSTCLRLMPPSISPWASSIQQLASNFETTHDAASFEVVLRDLHRALDARLGIHRQAATQQRALVQLDKLKSAEGLSVRARLGLELGLWSVLDKRLLGTEAGPSSEFLWLFGVPVQVKLRHASQLQLLQELELPLDEMLSAIKASGRVHTSPGGLRLAEAFVTSNDLARMGPYGFTQRFVDAEAEGEFLDLESLGLRLDQELAHPLAFTLFIPMASRMPYGPQQSVFVPETSWPSVELTQLLVAERSDLQALELEVLEPVSWNQAFLHSQGPLLYALAENLQTLQATQTAGTVALETPGETFYEVYVQDTSDPRSRYMLPPFASCEPLPLLDYALRGVCLHLGLPYAGAYRHAIGSSLLH